MSRRLRALVKKELRALFASPIAYIVLTAFVSLSGVYFFQHLINYNQLLFVYQSEGLGGGGFDQGTVPSQLNILNEVFVPAANDFSLLLLAVLPLVTMRVFAEERANGTDELLLTCSLRPWEIALAKHATTYGFVLLLLGVSAVFPGVAVSSGRLGSEHLLALYAGQFSFGVAIAAIGLACSSLTRSQVVAAVLAYAISFVLLDFGWLGSLASERTADVLRQISLLAHFDSFPRGVIPLRDVIYFGGVALCGFTVSIAALELQRAR